MKNKKIISGMLLMIFGLGLIVLANNNSFAISNNDVKVNMGITCDKTTLKPGEQTNCTLNSKLTNMTTTAIYSNMLNLSDNLEIISINKSDTWQGSTDTSDENIQLYSVDENNDNDIVTTISNEQIKFSNIKLYKTDSKDFVNASTSKSIKIKPDDVEDLDDSLISSTNLSKIEVIGQILILCMCL